MGGAVFWVKQLKYGSDTQKKIQCQHSHSQSKNVCGKIERLTRCLVFCLGPNLGPHSHQLQHSTLYMPAVLHKLCETLNTLCKNSYFNSSSQKYFRKYIFFSLLYKCQMTFAFCSSNWRFSLFVT